MTLPMKQPAQSTGDIMESVIIKGDLSKLTPEERVRYYNEVCKSLGLNPLTRPFEYLILNGKLILYANRSGADQLRKNNSVSLEIVSREVNDEILTIHVRARLPDGRSDEDLGAVAFPSSLRGDNRANMELKCITKAKRRATLSIVGLGWLDETEIEDIPASAKRPGPPAPNVMVAAPAAPAHDPNTGEIESPPKPVVMAREATVGEPAPAAGPPVDHTAVGADPPANPAEEFIRLDRMATEAAERGTEILKVWWKGLKPKEQRLMQKAMEVRHKPRADEVKKLAEADADRGESPDEF